MRVSNASHPLRQMTYLDKSKLVPQAWDKRSITQTSTTVPMFSPFFAAPWNRENDAQTNRDSYSDDCRSVRPRGRHSSPCHADRFGQWTRVERRLLLHRLRHTPLRR